MPSNCAAISSTPLAEAPTGGVSGTLTLINVASGLDFTVNAEALDELASRPFFRPATDPYPAFDAAEIDPVSVVTANGATYRSVWRFPADAVSAVLMREHAISEFVLDATTASLTDVVVTLPTRHYHANAVAAAAPFTTPARWSPMCLGGEGGRPSAEPLQFFVASREDRMSSVARVCDFATCPPWAPAGICASAAVASFRNTLLSHTTEDWGVFGSATLGMSNGGSQGTVTLASSTLSNGWIDLAAPGAPLVSEPQSTMLRHATGERVSGAHAFRGLPVTGFSARIFRNGTLRCEAGACQGNYGGAFPLKYRRNIAPAS